MFHLVSQEPTILPMGPVVSLGEPGECGFCGMQESLPTTKGKEAGSFPSPGT